MHVSAAEVEISVLVYEKNGLQWCAIEIYSRKQGKKKKKKFH